MMVGGGVDEELGPEEPRPVDEWPPPPSNVELTNKDGTSSRLLFLTVQYVGDDAGSSFNPGALESFPELEQRVVSPLDPNMGCTACYSPVYTPAPVSPSNGYLNPPSPSPASCLPESDMIVLSDQCQFSTAENYVVTTTAQNQEPSDDNKLLLLATDTSQPTELVVAGGQACADQRVELLLSNGTIAYGIVESTDDAGTRVIQIPREYLVASRTQHTVLSQELENEQNEKVQNENVQDESGHLRDIYSTLKEQGLIIEPGHLGMQSDLDQSQLESTLLDQATLTQEHMSPVFSNLPQRRYWCEECNVLLDFDCREHQINRKINDKAVPSRARATLPASYLAINKLDSDVEEYGVFARKSIPKRTQFGPIEGVIIKSEDILLVTQGINLVLTIETETGDLRTLDVSNEHMSNWMRFVRMATPDRHPNLLLSQLGASLFFTTTHTIHPREELLVWYSPTYATRRNLPPNPPPPEWLCSTCGIKLKTLYELNKHSDCHKDNSNYLLIGEHLDLNFQ